MSDLFSNVIAKVEAEIGRTLTPAERQQVGEEVLSQVKGGERNERKRVITNSMGAEVHVVDDITSQHGNEASGTPLGFLQDVDHAVDIRTQDQALDHMTKIRQASHKAHGIDTSDKTIAASTNREVRDRFGLSHQPANFLNADGSLQQDVRGALGNEKGVDLMRQIRLKTHADLGVTE